MNSIRKIFLILTPGDTILIIGLFIFSLVLNYLLIPNTQNGKMAVIRVNGKEIKRLELYREQRFEFLGTQGKFIVLVKDNTVRMLDSTCPDKLCVRIGSINKPNQVIVCVPNRVVIKIEGGTVTEQFDLITE